MRDPNEFQMSFGEHLEELRRRIIYALIGFGVACAVTLYFGSHLLIWLQNPLHQALRDAGLPAKSFSLSVTSGLAIYIKAGLIAGLIVAGPWILYQGWKFVEAGLYVRERRAVLILAPFSGLMTILGVLFAYYAMLPVALAFLIGFTASLPPTQETGPGMMDWLTRLVASYAGAKPPIHDEAPADPSEPDTLFFNVPVLPSDPASPEPGQVWINGPQGEMRAYFNGRVYSFIAQSRDSSLMPLIEIGQFMSFVLFVILGVVVAFQLPVVMMIVGWSGLVTPAFFTKYRRHCIFLCILAGALLTPSDPVSLFVMAIPLYLLFELGIVLIRVTGGKSVATKQ